MAQPKQKKKKSRSRSDPARREAAARRDEARRLAAEERRRAEEKEARHKKLVKTARRVAVPTVIGIGVVVTAIFVFRPQKELAGVEQLASQTIVTDLGYTLPEEIDADALPEPACGVFPEPLSSGEQFFSDLRAGAVVLWYRTADTETATALEGLAAGYESHVVVSPGDTVESVVLATSWRRRMAFSDPADETLAEFVDTYRKRGTARADCKLP